MPTPSAPGPPTPYIFSSTCPDTDDSSPPRSDTRIDLSTDSIRHHSAVTDEHSSLAARSPSEDIASRPSQLDPHHGQARDAEMTDDRSPSGDNPSYLESQHKSADHLDVERTDSPCDTSSSPIEPLQTSRPQRGVGTPPESGYDGDNGTTTKPQFPYAGYAMEEDYVLPSMGHDFPSRRMIPSSPSSFLRAGSRFTGTQQSERQVYDVQVEIKYVDLHESFLCGYLRIQGLTDDHPTLTTYFEGEIIGTKYGFMTKHNTWGANDKTDLSHWSKFPAFRPYSKPARRGSSVVIKDVAQSEHVFMRWKEHFLVPDHRVRTITGASFEGFYYICFNQIQGEVNGIYFHSKSERFQQLELKHVEDRGCFSALEFR